MPDQKKKSKCPKRLFTKNLKYLLGHRFSMKLKSKRLEKSPGLNLKQFFKFDPTYTFQFSLKLLIRFMRKENTCMTTGFLYLGWKPHENHFRFLGLDERSLIFRRSSFFSSLSQNSSVLSRSNHKKFLHFPV